MDCNLQYVLKLIGYLSVDLELTRITVFYNPRDA